MPYQAHFPPMPAWVGNHQHRPSNPASFELSEIAKLMGRFALPKPGPKPDPDHDAFLKIIRHHFDATVFGSGKVLFQTEDGTGPDLWSAYIGNAPPLERQTRTCNACRSFINRFGGLVTIDSATGKTTSAIWPSSSSYTVPYSYRPSVSLLKDVVERRKVSGVFVTAEAELGTTKTGPWTHLAVPVPYSQRWKVRSKTAEQLMAEKLEDFGMLSRAIDEFSYLTANQASHFLATGGVYRAEKVAGAAKWFRDLHAAIALHPAKRHNVIWSAVSTAPAGFCHVKGSMLGSLLEDIHVGLSAASVKERFEKKMNPLQYQRPTAAPAAGNILAAEKLVEQLGIKDSLHRRFARLSDVECLWTPKAPAPPARKAGPYDVFGVVGVSPGTFSHIQPKGPPAPPEPKDSGLPVQLMTWSKFQRTVLKTAEQIEYNVPYTVQPYLAHVTAKFRHAPNMLQWNNPVSYYLHVNGGAAHNWNLIPGTWCKVTAVVLRPWLWGSNAGGSPTEHLGQGATLILDGCRDLQHTASGGMFPELLKSEYHGVRATLEAHFRTARIEGKNDPDLACGIAIHGDKFEVNVRVTSNGIRTLYRIDRWD